MKPLTDIKIFRRTALSMFGCLLASALWCDQAVSASANLLKNPTFNASPRSEVARHWHDNSGWADADVRYKLVRTADGATAQLIECHRFQRGAVQFVQSGIAVHKERSYQISVRMKGDVHSPVEILLRQRGKPYTTYGSAAFKVTDKWKTYSFTAISRHDDESAYFMISFTDRGKLMIGRAELYDVTETIAQKRPRQGNLIPNSSFEVGLDRWGVQVRDHQNLAAAMQIRFSEPAPHIVDGNSPEGRSHLRIDLPSASRLNITSPYVEISPGNQYTISCWLAADRPMTVSLGFGRGDFNTGSTIRKSFRLTTKWRRIFFSAVLPPAPENRYFFKLQAIGPGKIKLDGTSLSYGENPEQYSTKELEVGFSRENQQTIFFRHDPVPISTRVINRTDQNIVFTVKSYDFWQNERILVERKMGPGASDLVFEFPSETKGYYRLRAEVSAKGTIHDAAEMAIGIVNPPRLVNSVDSPFGAHVSFTPRMLEYARMLGVKWLRMHPPHGTKWFIVQKEKGDFRFYDEPIVAAQEKGFMILGLLADTPRWASSAPPDQRSERVGSFRSYPPRRISDWRNYVYETTKHYAGVIDHWEVWNEPDIDFLKINRIGGAYHTKSQAYSHLLQVAHEAARQGNPGSTIVGGCASHAPPTKWVRKIFREGAYQHMDVLSFHRYTDGRPADVLPTPTGRYVSELKDLMRRYGDGRVKPIWESESGLMHPRTSYANITEVSHKYTIPAEDGPSYLVRNYIHLLAHGVAKWFYYHMFVNHRIDRREGSGFFEWDGSPRPLAIAYSVLAGILEGASFENRLNMPPGIEGYRFRDENRRISIVWNKRPSTAPTEVLLEIESVEKVDAINIMGNAMRSSLHNNQLIFEIDQQPVYVIEHLS